MLEQQINSIIFNYSYIQLFGLSFCYFLILYFGLAPLFNAACKSLASKNRLHKILQKEINKKQIYFEIKNSLISIIIFGASIIPIIFLLRIGIATFIPSTFLNVFIGLVLLTIWNEIHFYIVHRAMHLPFFMQHIHAVHHQSKVPTVYSVYSFHWIEAILLSSVPLCMVLFVPLAALSIVIYPLVSILFNFAGHCNYRVGNGKGSRWQLFGTLHNLHHSKGQKNYGFVLTLFDDITSKVKNRKFNNTNK